MIINYSAIVARELEAVERASDDERWTVMRQNLGEIQLAAERARRLTQRMLSVSRGEKQN